jgi:hypothetical protein
VKNAIGIAAMLATLVCVSPANAEQSWVLWFLTSNLPLKNPSRYDPVRSFNSLEACEARVVVNKRWWATDANEQVVKLKELGAMQSYVCFPSSIDPRPR